ncbi:MAG: M28 family peptidase [Vicinamibacterales bacterium]
MAQTRRGTWKGRMAAAVLATGLAACGGTGVESAPAPAQPVAVQASPLDATRLMDSVRTLTAPEMNGRGAGTVGNQRARAWIVDRFTDIGLRPIGEAYLHTFRYTPKSGPAIDAANVLGTCPGTVEGAPSIVLSAHYDHLGVRSGEVYPGADDNASGVAVLLGIAEACMREPFRHPLIVAAFDAEEGGLRGARAFVDKPPVPRESLALDVNLDMVSRSDVNELYVAGTYHSPELKPVLDAVASRAPVKLLFGHDRPEDGEQDWTQQSDHGPFHDAGIPFVYFGVEDHADYHRPSDTPDKINPAFFHDAAVTILDAMRALDAHVPVQ